jgi:acyl-CoA thioester hydrolase
MVGRPPPRSREHYSHFTRITTRWGDNDAYGHVNNTVYYAWFDSAVNAWLVGQGLLDIAAGDPIALVVETGCRYFAPLSFPEEVDVGIAVERIGTSSVTYRIGVFAAGSEAPAAEGHFTHVAVDRESRRPVPWPAAWRERFAALG